MQAHNTLVVPVLASARLRSWPKHEKGGAARYTPLANALAQDYRTDAHFTAYSVPALERRLSLDALRLPSARDRLPDGVRMVLALFDVDCAAAHKGELGTIDDWWLEELEKVRALLERHPGGFVYRTRGGYRIVYVLPDAILLKDDTGADAWSHRYCTWIAYLGREFRIDADPACKDWTRLFRVPHATRDKDGVPEHHETLGEPSCVGAWTCEPSEKDAAKGRRLSVRRSKRRRRRTSRRCSGAESLVGEGVLHSLFSAHDWLGDQVEAGTWAVVCPNEEEHTKGESLDGSTVLFAPTPGNVYGLVYCWHAHCQQRTLRDVLDAFTAKEIAEARAACVPAATARSVSDPGEDSDDRRPKVYVPGAHTGEDGAYFEVGTHEFAAAVLDAIGEGVLYRMDFVVGQIVGKAGRRRFREIDEHTLRQLVDAHARLVRGVEDPETLEPTVIYRPCTRDRAGLVQAAAVASPLVRELQLIVQYPVYVPGFELAVPEWNERGGVFYDEPPELAGLIPAPKPDWAVLGDLVVDFPLKDAASYENVVGLQLTLVLRPAINGPIPFHLFLASLERTGKGKLIDTAAGVAVIGEQIPPIQLGSSEEEREKRITSLLIAGASAIHFDNIPGGEVIGSASLASLATAYPRWRGRLLGKSKIPDLPNRVAVMMSGNNIRATGELCKRTVPIVLESKTPYPELRDDFLHPDALAHGLSKRRDVLAVLLGFVERWKEAGKPGATQQMGGFERWVDAVGGVLQEAGATAWMTNYVPWIRAADDEGADAEALVEEWARLYGETPVTATQILAMVRDTKTFSNVLTAPSPEGQLVSLARRVLTPLTNRPVGGWIVRRKGSGSSSTYNLAKAMP